jgi:hypothetical protein
VRFITERLRGVRFNFEPVLCQRAGFPNAFLMINAVSSHERCAEISQMVMCNPGVHSCVAAVLFGSSVKVGTLLRPKIADSCLQDNPCFS